MANLPTVGIQFNEHRLTKQNQPCTNGHVNGMNRTIKDTTAKRFHYDSHIQLRTVHGSLQRHPASQDPWRPHTLLLYLQELNLRANSIHPQSDPPDAGTEQLRRSFLIAAPTGH